MQQIIQKSVETLTPCDHVEFQRWQLNYVLSCGDKFMIIFLANILEI